VRGQKNGEALRSKRTGRPRALAARRPPRSPPALCPPPSRRRRSWCWTSSTIAPPSTTWHRSHPCPTSGCAFP
jgi:hypothetical protein